jgi:uncharacterized protein YciI
MTVTPVPLVLPTLLPQSSNTPQRSGQLAALLLGCFALCLWNAPAWAEQVDELAAEQTSKPSGPATYDAELAARLGADERGMRQYVLVILKTGPTPVTDPEARKAMFAGHFANMTRLSEAGKLVLAGPLDGVDGWRGLFVYAVTEIDEAEQLTATDPVIIEGEMVAEYHQWYGTAGVMMLPEIHASLARSAP